MVSRDVAFAASVHAVQFKEPADSMTAFTSLSSVSSSKFCTSAVST